LSKATKAFIDGGEGDKINHTIHGIGFILKKLLWIEEREIRSITTSMGLALSLKSFMSGLERIFAHLFVKNFPKLGWHEYNSETECQLAWPLWSISRIGASSTLWNRANGKRELFKDILQEMSSGHMKSILRGI